MNNIEDEYMAECPVCKTEHSVIGTSRFAMMCAQWRIALKHIFRKFVTIELSDMSFYDGDTVIEEKKDFIEVGEKFEDILPSCYHKTCSPNKRIMKFVIRISFTSRGGEEKSVRWYDVLNDAPAIASNVPLRITYFKDNATKYNSYKEATEGIDDFISSRTDIFRDGKLYNEDIPYLDMTIEPYFELERK